MRANDRNEVREMLLDRIADLAARLFPDGVREGRHWVAHGLGDEPRQVPALKIALSGDKGAWKDWRGGDKGGVFELIMYRHNCDFAEAMRWARDFVGIARLSPAERQKLAHSSAERRVRDEKEQLAKRAFKLQTAQKMFVEQAALGTQPVLDRLFEDYLLARDIDVRLIRHLNRESFRLSPGTEWWKGAKWEYEQGRRFKVAEGPYFPAIHSGMRVKTGIVTCCHVTFLDPVRPKKAPVDPPKLMFGEALRAVIEVATGPSGLPFWSSEPQTPAPLVLAEGIETALSLAVAIPDVRVWAAGSLAGMGAAPVDLACVSDVTVARDNNDGNAQAQRQLEDCLTSLNAYGKPVVVMASHVGDDFNDLMTGEQ